MRTLSLSSDDVTFWAFTTIESQICPETDLSLESEFLKE